jgi:predicted dehydrogenase
MHHMQAMLHLKSANELHIAGVVNRAGSAARLQSVPIVPMFDSLEDMIGEHRSNAHGCFDAIVIATPDHLHADHVVQCLGSGIAVLVEKPFTQNTNDAKRCINAAEANNLLLRVGYQHRFHVGHAALKESLAEIGFIRKIEASWSWFDPQRSGWRSDPQSSQSWALAALGTHLIDFAAWITQQKVTDVTAELSPNAGPEHSAVVNAMLGDTELNIQTSIDKTESSHVVIMGNLGSVVCDATFGAHGRGTITKTLSDGYVEEVCFVPQQPYTLQLKDFLNCYTAGFARDDTLIDNVRVLEDIKKASL